MKKNLLLMVDSYKMSHWKQYPSKSNGYYGYIESRGSDSVYTNTLFFGLQIFLKKYLTKPFNLLDVIEAREFAKVHGEPFNEEGWMYILEKYKGYLPIRIKAVPEGTLVPMGMPLVTVESTDDKVFWVGSYVETCLLRAVWYPTTVATNSYYCKQVILDYLNKTSDNPQGTIAFKLHDFGGRGVSSGESAEIGGAAHLVNFMGSDTIEGVLCANENYNCNMSAFSIPAAEHSTITSWGKDNEIEAYRNMIKQYGGKDKLVACVSDSYDIYKACEMWGTYLKDDIINSGTILIVRPDSGDPVTVVHKVISILSNYFGHTLNKKGFKVLNNVRVIQGDGINRNTIQNILSNLYINGWSADNIAFGMGGALLQQLDRDTMKFAMKCSAIRIDGVWKDVSKNPVTDTTKKSKGGRVSTFIRNNGEMFWDTIEGGRWIVNSKDLLVPVFENGILLKDWTLDEIRANANR